ncbi:MAG TPA: GrpB family protein [Candidatus Dormibacteraeota bacterium]
MTETAGGLIEPYEHTPASCRAFDPHAGEVAERVAALLRSRLSELQVEHVGSTAIPGCAGKGIIDLMAIYPDGMLEQARDAVDSLGFQPQTFGEPFPEDRPMRVGTMRLRGRRYRIHVHVIAASSDEVDALRTFRDRLRRSSVLVRDYVARKRNLIARGVTESPDYARAKGGFISSVLSGDRPRIE